MTRIISLTIIIILVIIGGSCLLKSGNEFSELTNNDKIRNDFIQEDSLKLISLNFLLENAEDKYSVGRLSLKQPDVKTLDKEYLFNNTELSISNSIRRLNDAVFTVDQFLNYILPYRLRHEKLENWKELGFNKFKALYDNDIFIHSKNINDELKKTFTYSGRSKANRKFSDLINDCYGGCNEMSDLAAFSMRANGIPVAVDFAKWSNIIGNHQWNSLITKNNNIPFMGIETDPIIGNNIFTITGNYKKFAKVYRKSFKKYESKFQEFNPKKLINSLNYIDVTKEYCPDCKDIFIKFPNESVNNEVFFLCVYEVNGWIPVDYAFGKKNTLTFKDVCPNNIFALKKRVNNKLEYFKTPFTFNQSGEVSFVKTDQKETGNLNLTFDNSNYRELIKMFNEIGLPATEGIQDSILQYNYTAKVINGNSYKLFYWNNEWIYYDEQIAQNGSIKFIDIPKNALYKLEDINDSKSTRNRCFTTDKNNKQFWW